MDFRFNKGQRLVLQLNSDEIFEGNYESGTDTRIDLINVELPKGHKIKHMLSYYRSEITAVRLLNEENTKTDSASEKKQQPQLPQKVIAIARDEYERLEDMTNNYLYMATMDKRYIEATDHLINCESVGIAVVGSEFGRTTAINLLVMSSWDRIYIFDIRIFQQKRFAQELGYILESNSIKKVVHDVRSISDCLWHRYKITVNNIFDTQVADMVVVANQKGNAPQTSRSLPECLSHYFNFPTSLFAEAENVSVKEWEQRPLDGTLKMLASLQVTYLIMLKCKLEDLMLQNFHTAVGAYSTVLKDADQLTAQLNVKSKGIPSHIQDLVNTCRWNNSEST